MIEDRSAPEGIGWRPLQVVVILLGMLCILLGGLWAWLMSTREEWATPPPRAVRMEPLLGGRKASDFGPDSAYAQLLQIEAAVKALEPSHWRDRGSERVESLGWKEGETPELDAVMDAAGNIIALMRKARADQAPQVPTVVSFEDQLSYLGPTRNLIRLTTYRAERACAQGRKAEAFEELALALDHGSLVARGGVLISQLVHVACEALVLEGIGRLAWRHGPDQDILRHMIRRIEEHERHRPALAEAFRHERTSGLNSLTMCYDGKAREWDLSFPLPMNGSAMLLYRLLGSNLDNTRRNFDRLYGQAILLAEDGDLAALAAFDDQPGRISGMGRLLRIKDPLGCLLAGMMLPAIKKACFADMYSVARLRVTRVFLAVQLYRLSHGGLPQDLEALVPGGLSSVPDDPFDRAPLRYRRGEDGFMVYSVGADGVDNGGAGNGETWDQPDFVLSANVFIKRADMYRREMEKEEKTKAKAAGTSSGARRLPGP